MENSICSQSDNSPHMLISSFEQNHFEDKETNANLKPASMVYHPYVFYFDTVNIKCLYFTALFISIQEIMFNVTKSIHAAFHVLIDQQRVGVLNKVTLIVEHKLFKHVETLYTQSSTREKENGMLKKSEKQNLNHFNKLFIHEMYKTMCVFKFKV